MKNTYPCHTQLSRVVRETINISRCIAVQHHEQRRGSFNKHNPTNATHMEMWEAEPRTYLRFYSSFSEFTWRLALSTLSLSPMPVSRSIWIIWNQILMNFTGCQSRFMFIPTALMQLWLTNNFYDNPLWYY